ncbi:MAG: phosphatidylglycerophosphatase A [Gammaproteobacteria bacterium]|nr:phosphatidylglycerophosphatase A [Gammaproteobacteria bacterium]
MATSKDTSTSKDEHFRDYTNIPPIPPTVWTNPLHFVAFGFGTGTIPFAPGTFGTLIAIPFYLAMQSLSATSYFAILLLVIAASIWICHKVTEEIGIEDHQGMCLDEVVGYLVTMFCAPHGWKWIWIGFLLFRIFDILKPWPIRYIDRKMTGGVGIILDDVLAGVMSCIILQIFARVL